PAKRGRRGVVEPHRRAGAVVPVLTGDAPRPVGFAGDGQPAKPATVADGLSGGVDLLGRPGPLLGRRAAGDPTPLHGPPGLAAVDLKDVAVAPGVEEHQ